MLEIIDGAIGESMDNNNNKNKDQAKLAHYYYFKEFVDCIFGYTSRLVLKRLITSFN